METNTPGGMVNELSLTLHTLFAAIEVSCRGA